MLRAVDGSSVSCKMIPLVDEAKERRGRGYKVERGRASCTAKLLLLRAGREIPVVDRRNDCDRVY